MPRKRKGRWIYGPVDKPSDIKKINMMIRRQMRKAKSRARIIELQKRSHYLYTLTHAPNMKKKLKGKVLAARKIAKREFEKTKLLARILLRRAGR